MTDNDNDKRPEPEPRYYRARRTLFVGVPWPKRGDDGITTNPDGRKP